MSETSDEERELLDAIAADLYSDAPRLVYADWCEQRGDTKRAKFIRLQCDLEPLRDRYEIPRVAELHASERELLGENRKRWTEALPEGFALWESGAQAEFRRGLIDTVSMPVHTWLRLGEQLRRSAPALRRLVLFRVDGHGAELAACRSLAGLAEIELACWYSDEDAAAFALSPYLSELQILELWLGRAVSSDDQLCTIMGEASRAWPALRELSLLELDGESLRRLVSVTNRAAGRSVAIHRRGYPDHFPFAPDFFGLFPGRLPDGRQAIAAPKFDEPQLSLCIFDEDGKPTESTLELPLPDDLADVPQREHFRYYERMRQHLQTMLGLQPAFLRVRGVDFPWDDGGYHSPDRGFYEEWDLLGQPDDESTFQEEPRGIGGKLAWIVREGQYVIRWEHWADKRGRVHST